MTKHKIKTLIVRCKPKGDRRLSCLCAIQTLRHPGLVVLLVILVSCATVPHRPAVQVLQGSDFTVYQGEAVTVWFSYWFQIGFVYRIEQKDEAIAAYHRDLSEIGELFRKGIARGEVFFDELGLAYNAKPPRLVIHLSSATHHELPEALIAFDGPIVKILNVERLGNSRDGTRRSYDLWITFSKDETGWGSFEHFRLTVINPKATPETPPAEFATGATVEEFYYSSTEF